MLIKAIQHFHADIVYHRSLETTALIKAIARNTKVVVEINGNEIGKLSSQSRKYLRKTFDLLKIALFKSFLKRFLSIHQGLIFVTYELQKIYTQLIDQKNPSPQSIVIPNSINIDEFKWRKTPRSLVGDKVKLAFVGTPNLPWHGVHIIVKLAERTQDLFEFHIIGEDLLQVSPIPSNIIKHGFLSKDKYRDILAQCDIGIGTLSIKAAKITEACALKVREYAAAGLPFIYAYKDTAFLSRGTPEWALELPTDEATLLQRLDVIKDFCFKFRDYVVSEEEVRRYFDFEAGESNRLNFFEKLIHEM
ncbi:MAG: glycosyltransferase [Bacteroidota bacterium]|nr:glycosyltransferase [Bacteroidota bacterium]